jgi:beta-glucosidase
VSGKEIIQAYASKPETEIDRPVRELKAFVKTILLEPGETTEVGFNIPVSDLSYWDETINGWNLENGSYAIEVGASSRDIRLSQEINIKNKGH